MMTTIQNNQFTECADCASKSGSPTLCDACYKNRQLVEALKRQVEEVVKTHVSKQQIEDALQSARKRLDDWKPTEITAHNIDFIEQDEAGELGFMEGQINALEALLRQDEPMTEVVSCITGKD